MARISIAGNYFQSFITTGDSYQIRGGKIVPLPPATNGADAIVGGKGSDYIDAADGNDRISGGNGKDEIHAGAGDDMIGSISRRPPGKLENGTDGLYGDAGNDLIYGGNGVDRFSGGADGDVLFGGGGKDVFSYSRASDSAYTVHAPIVLPENLWNAADGSAWIQSWDVIADFRSGLDRIDLSGLSAGDAPALFWRGATGTDTDAGAANAALAYGVWTDAAQNFLYADTSGDGQADLKIQARGVDESDVRGLSSLFEITSGAAASVPENTPASVVVYDGNAIDPDGATLVYSITGTDAARFVIDPNDGEVRFVAPRNFEAPVDVGGNNVYDFVLHVNNGVTELTRDVAITVTNQDEDAPTFTSATTAAAIDENSGENLLVYDANASDPASDGGPSIPVTYSFGGGTDDGLFTIDGNDGEVRLVANPDFENRASYSFDVRATDGAGNSTTQTVSLTVNNVDEAPAAKNDAWVLSDTAIAAGILTASWFTQNDSDPESAALAITAVTGLAGSGLAANFDDGKLVDITGTAIAGSYSLDYTLSDGSLVHTASVSLTVLDATEGGDSNPVLDGNDFSFIEALGGDDTVSGDALLGTNAGIDVITGGAGNDTLSGGAGADAFVFGTALDAVTNMDTISDFTPGTDTLRLDVAVFTALALGALGATQFNSGAGLTAATDADDRIVYDTATGALYYDADGLDGAAATQFAVLGVSTHPAITAADFLIVA